MARIILRVIFILSISFNIAFFIHLLGHTPGQKNIQLNMTEEQREVESRIHLKMHKENEGIKKKIRECQTQMIDALKAVKVDRDKIIKCSTKISNLQRQIQLNTVDEIIQVKK